MARRDLDLVLIGAEGWKVDVPKLLGSIADSARLVGFVPPVDLAAAYAGAAVFCYPSHREGFGLPVLEAMAQGTPVVTSIDTATAEVAEGVGVLVDPADPDSIATGLGRVLDNASMAEDLGRAGRTRAAYYSWARAAELTLAAYRDVVP